jgi:hypothetical protein
MQRWRDVYVAVKETKGELRKEERGKRKEERRMGVCV